MSASTVAAATARLMAAERPTAIDAALRASLTQQHGLMPVTRAPDSPGGYFVRMSASRTPDFEGARRAVEMACLPASGDVILQALVILRAQSAVREAADVDMEIQAKVYSDNLAEWPADCALWVLKTWPRRSKWWPAWFELQERLEKIAGDRLAIRRALPAIEAEWKRGAEDD